MDLTGKTVLVTGGASGLGEATARYFVERGSNVVVFDRDGEEPPTLLNPDTDLVSPALNRPMDCLIAGDRLYVADGGENERLSAVHIFQIHDIPTRPSPDDLQLKKLYG